MTLSAELTEKILAAVEEGFEDQIAFTEALARQDPMQAGLLDLNRYIDPKPSEAD